MTFLRNKQTLSRVGDRVLYRLGYLAASKRAETVLNIKGMLEKCIRFSGMYRPCLQEDKGISLISMLKTMSRTENGPTQTAAGPQ